jgi:hypothetical protein
MKNGFTLLFSSTLKIMQLDHHIFLKIFFFNETLHTQRSQILVLEPFINQLDGVELTNSHFQQDSARAHTATTTIHYLEEFFPSRLISVELPLT